MSYKEDYVIEKLKKKLFAGKETSTDKQFYLIYKHGLLTWLIEKQFNKPYFLATYSPTTWKANFFCVAVWVIWLLKCQRFFFKRESFSVANDSIYEKLSNKVAKKAIFTGTKGDNRKAVIFVKEKNKKGFAKVPIEPGAKKTVKNELTVLKQVSEYKFSTAVTPKLLVFNEYPIIEDITPKKKNISLNITDNHMQFYNELYEYTKKTITINDFLEIHDCRNKLETAKKELNELKNKKLKNLVSDLLEILLPKISELENIGDENISVYQGHGDFTPWNCFVDRDNIAVFDWELSNNNLPAYYDVLHFIISSSVLVKHESADEIQQQLDKLFLSNNIREIEGFLKLYLIYVISYYLKIYISLDNEGDAQVFWALQSYYELLQLMV